MLKSLHVHPIVYQREDQLFDETIPLTLSILLIKCVPTQALLPPPNVQTRSRLEVSLGKQ